MKLDWFKMYPTLFLQDGIVDAMSTLELGATMRLLFRQWIDGDLKDDKALLARQARISEEEMESFWPRFCAFFPTFGEGRRANCFLQTYRQEAITKIEALRESGRAAAKRRWTVEGFEGTCEATESLTSIPLGDPMLDKKIEEQRKQDVPNRRSYGPRKTRATSMDAIRAKAGII